MHFGLLQRRLVAHLRSRVRSGELTERSAARLTGVSQPHLHNVLKGTRLLSTDMADQVLHNLKLCLFDLLEPEELRSYEERADARRGAVPVLAGRLGPGCPYPACDGPWQPFPFLQAGLDRLGDPALVELTDDPPMRRLFHGGDMALVDRTPARRRAPEPDGCYAVDLGTESVIRCVRCHGDRLWLLALDAGDPLSKDCISLAERNILEVVRAKVIWIGRHLEPPPVAKRSTEQTG